MGIFLELNAPTGQLSWDSHPLNFSSHAAALRSAVAAGLPAEWVQRPWGQQFAAPVEFLGQPFLLCCDFPSGPSGPTVVILYWQAGTVHRLGWDASQDDLKSDRDQLAGLLSDHLQTDVQHLSNGVQRFDFPWGSLTAGASLQAMVVSIAIQWQQ